MAATSAADNDLAEIPDYVFDKFKDGAKMRLLEIQPAPTDSETLNCKLLHVPVRKRKTKDGPIQQKTSPERERSSISKNDVKQSDVKTKDVQLQEETPIDGERNSILENDVKQSDGLLNGQADPNANDKENTISSQADLVTNGKATTGPSQDGPAAYDEANSTPPQGDFDAEDKGKALPSQADLDAKDKDRTNQSQAGRPGPNDTDQALAHKIASNLPEYEIDMPRYEALSYRWGTGEPTQSIRIHKNGGIYRFQIHKHLHDALIALRHKSTFRNLWVDNICVNQRDSAERSEQVARMSEVYGEAFNVCIWLGEAEEDSRQALEFLAKQGLRIYQFDELCNDESFVRRWASFLTLLKRDWFSRRWVVQEVSLAQSATVHCGDKYVNWEDFADAVSLLNDIDLSAKKLSNAARKLESLDHPLDLFGEIGALPATHLVNTANRMFKKSIGGHQRLSTLEQIVARLSMFQSGEPRDYIYALLALAKDSQPYAGLPDHLDGRPLTPANKRALQAVIRLLPSAHRQTYNVDYNSEVVDVYQQFIAFALSKSDPALALDIICRPFAPSNLKGLPSWIPVVSELPFAPLMNLKKGHFKMERQRGDPFVSMPDTFPQYNAAGRKSFNRNKVRFRKRSDHYSMFVEGFVLDTVVKVEPASQMGNIPEEWVALAKHQKDEEAFWKTLVADRGPKGGVPGIYGKAIKAALRVADNGLDIAGHMREHPSTIISDALPHVQHTIWGRCLIETERQYLGLGPKKLEKASRDAGKTLLACIIHGCTVPIILQEWEKTNESIERESKEDEADRLERQKKAEKYIAQWAAKQRKRTERPQRRDAGDRKSRAPTRSEGHKSAPKDASPPRVYYKVIGECYIHNMMHGEAIKWQNDTINNGVENRVKTQIFELR